MAGRSIIGAVALLAIASPARAQSPVGSDRIRINVDAGAQFSSVAFDTSATKAVYIENAVIDASYKISHGLAIDGGVSIRLAGDVSVGVTVSSFTGRADAAVSAAIPHPFFFRMPRTISGTASGLHRDELVTHIQGIYTLHPRRTLDVALSAGPSLFSVRQDVVTNVAFTDTYPFDAPAYTSAASQRVTASNTVGFNVGADVGLRLSRHAGVGASVRFSRATVSLTVPNSTTTVSADAGGTQIAGGLRMYF
ncbi:MAG: hypothetical protein ACRD2I_05585 [Vicinamibacterales bacterium]